MKPIIGIIAKHRESEGVIKNTFIRDDLKSSIFNNGGIAFAILPPSDMINFFGIIRKSTLEKH